MAGKSVFSFADKDGDAAGAIEERIGELDLEGAGIDIPNSVLNRIIAVKEEHEKFMEIDNAYKAERVIIEKKYFALKAEVWKQRTAIISGGADVEAKVPIQEGDDSKEIPSFWAAALSNHGTVGQLVTEKDMEALEALADITVEYNENWSGFTLTFVFKENKFFSNTELKKVYEVSPDLLEEKAPELNSVQGTEINWKAGMNLCVAETKKKQKAKSGRNAGQVRFVVKTTPTPSFFHYFSDPKMSEEDEEDEEDEDDEHGVTLDIDEDYEIAHAFRTEIIPDALLWYTGEAMEDHGEEEEDDEEESDDEDGPDKESTEVSGSAATGFTAAGAGAPGAQDPNAPECKQS